jgi:hypothetical protein
MRKNREFPHFFPMVKSVISLSNTNLSIQNSELAFCFQVSEIFWRTLVGHDNIWANTWILHHKNVPPSHRAFSTKLFLVEKKNTRSCNIQRQLGSCVIRLYSRNDKRTWNCLILNHLKTLRAMRRRCWKEFRKMISSNIYSGGKMSKRDYRTTWLVSCWWSYLLKLMIIFIYFVCIYLSSHKSNISSWI